MTADRISVLDARMIAERFPFRLREIRQRKQLKVVELAAACPNIDERGIYRYETGDRLPSLQSLVELAQALGVTVTELVGA